MSRPGAIRKDGGVEKGIGEALVARADFFVS